MTIISIITIATLALVATLIAYQRAKSRDAYIALLERQLNDARRNDYRDPETGKFARRPQ